MKYYFLLILSVLFISCSEDSEPISYQTEEDIIQYLDGNGIDAIRSESGLYYKVATAGNGKIPSEDAKVTFSYEVSLLDGTIVETSDAEGYTLLLHNLLPGLSEGLKYFDEESEGTLIIPPSLGYGFVDRNGVKAGSVLIFEIKILEVTEAEDEILQYLDNHELEAQKSESGLYYIINTQGEGLTPTSSSNVTVAYKGYFTDETLFDESDSEGISFNLQDVIEGWKEGITYFNEGGEGLLLVPPHLGYGYADYNGIPAGSVLVFEVKLISVN